MMLQIIFGIFLLLHGLVHLLYFGHSQHLFLLQPKMRWPDNSWLFSRFFGDGLTRGLVSLFCMLSAVGFSTAGMLVLLDFPFWKPVVITAAILSSLLFVFCWDGKSENLNDKGAIGLFINLTLLILVLFFPFISW